jgi:hypothetical protein
LKAEFGAALSLAFLDPAIVEAIAESRRPTHFTAETLTRRTELVCRLAKPASKARISMSHSDCGAAAAVAEMQRSLWMRKGFFGQIRPAPPSGFSITDIAMDPENASGAVG